MPRTYTRTFRVRYAECDAYGHVNNAHYLRYMQETAFDASAEAGYGLDRYTEMNRLWLVRETDIEYLNPLCYNDTVVVTTWVADFHQVRSARAYELRLAPGGELAARARTNWVFLNASTRQPAPIPQSMKEAFFPEGVPDEFPPSERFPAAPPPPPGVFTSRRRVAWRDIDMAGIVNNPVYLEYVEDCGFQAVAAHGWPVQRMTGAGFAIFIRRHQIQYLQPARLDDELEIATWASGLRRSTATRHYTIRRVSDGELLARVHSLGVWIDLASRRPIRIPPELIADFAPNLVQNNDETT